MSLFLKVTLAVAAGLVLLAIVGALLHVLVIAALIAAVVVGVTWVVGRFRSRRGVMVATRSVPRRF
jgi:hypothetical protein